MIIQTSAS